MAKRSIQFLLLLVLFSALPYCHARPSTKRLKASSSATKGQRGRKGWRRRAQDYQEAKEQQSKYSTTIVTNPSSLGSSGKGKGKGGQVVYTEEDNDGRTTFVVKCDDNVYRKAYVPNEKTTKSPPGKAGGSTALARKGSGKGKGTSASTYSSARPTDPESKTSGTGDYVTDVCDDYDDGTETGGGWYSGDGGSGDGGTDGSGSGAVVEGEVDVVVVPGGSSGDIDYPSYDDSGPDTGLLEGAYGNLGLSGCDEISAGSVSTNNPSQEVRVTLDIVHEIESNADDQGTDSIHKLMRADLQDHVAPVIADCLTDSGDLSPSGSAYGAIASGSGSVYGNTQTLITNVNFTELSGQVIDCKDYQTFFPNVDPSNYKCVYTTIPVDLYYDGSDTSFFQDRVQDAIDDHTWDVPGLMMTSVVHTPGSNSGSVSKIEGDQAQEGDTVVGPGGYLAIAGACLLLVLAAIMMYRRKREQEMEVKHVSLDDDDDTYLKDIEGESNHSGASMNQLANVVGDDTDSVNTGWTGASTHFRNANAIDAMFSNTESRPSHQDVHVCSSATCEVCERNRQMGVQFIPSGTTPPHPPLPPDTPRQYAAEDTVAL